MFRTAIHSPVSRSLAARAAALIGSTLVFGCGAMPPESEELSSTREALSCGSGCQDFTDSTGSITIRVRTCALVTATGTDGSQTAQTTCPVSSSTADSDWKAGFVMVGGGAEIANSPLPAPLLKTSMPDLTSLRNSSVPTKWLARSGQYTKGAVHSLRAYWIGLRLTGMTADELTQNGNYYINDSQSAVPGPFTATIPPDFILVGGGGTGFDMFLTDSEPDDTWKGWKAEAHMVGNVADPAGPKAVAIGMARCPVRANRTTWGCLGLSGMSSGLGNLTGYKPVQTRDTSQSPGMMTSIGGTATSTTAGARRFLTDLIPIASFNGVQAESATVWSVDAAQPANGMLTATLVELNKL